MKTRIIKFKDEYKQDVWLAQKKGWLGWKPLYWTAEWHFTLEEAQKEIDTAFRNLYIDNQGKEEIIQYP